MHAKYRIQGLKSKVSSTVHHCLSLLKTPYQSPAAEQNHEDDKGLKPAVFHNLVAGLPQPPPEQAQTTAVVEVTALTVL